MAISHHIKDIGRGAAGARALSRDAAADLLGQILDGHCSDLEIGAFCVAMRIKGETPEEMAGFLDALNARLHKLPASARPVVVLPSYNGARKLPVLTPLLAALLAREGLPVLIHVADPVAFFDPITPENERWDELGNHPEWSFPPPDYPPFDTIISGFANLVRHHPPHLQAKAVGAEIDRGDRRQASSPCLHQPPLTSRRREG